MDLTLTWFDLNENKNDLENVLTFIDQLSPNFRQIFDNKTSNFINQFIEKDNNYGITNELFHGAFNEANKELEEDLIRFRRDLKLDSILGGETAGREAADTLLQIGFTKQSLKLKAAVLNKLWLKVISQVNSLGIAIIDFANNPIVKLVRRFLAYLNSIINSLLKLIPGLEALKEFKEIIESYLAIADED